MPGLYSAGRNCDDLERRSNDTGRRSINSGRRRDDLEKIKP